MPFANRPPRLSSIATLRNGARSLAGTVLAGTLSGTPGLAQPAPMAPAAVQIGPVSVQSDQGTGYQAQVPALQRLTEPLLDTPQSVSVVPKQLMEDQATVSVRDALRNVPGISLAAGEAGAQGDSLTLRGFTARNDFYLDGMRDFGSYTRDPFNFESVEVLKGPASVLFGRGSTGGVINQVSKQPTLRPITAGTVTFGTDGTSRFTADVDRPIDGIPNSAVRLNVMGNLNGVAGRPEAEYRRFGFAPSVAFGIGTDTRLTINYLHQQENDVPDYGLPWLYGRPAPVSNSNFYGFRNNDYLRSTVDIGTIRLEHDVSDSLTLRSQLRFANYQRAIRVVEPQVIYTGITPATPLSAISVNRNMIAANSTETFLQNQSDVVVRFRTGPFEHALVAGFEVGQETSAPDRFTYTGVPTTSLLYPSATPFAGTARLTSAGRTKADTAALSAVDTIKFGEHWQLIAGLRWDDFRTTFDQKVPPISHFSTEDSMLSWRAGLVYKPVPAGSFYVAYGTSFNPSAETLTLAASSADLAPEKNVTYEIGTKWDINGGRLSLSGALFQIEKTNARVPDPNNPLFNILGGDQRVRGFELGAAGYLTDAWELYAGYAFLDNQVVASTVASSVGEALGNVPRHSMNIWSSYRLPWHDVEIGGGMQYVSSRLAASTVNAASGQFNRAPGYVTFQAMVKVPVRPGFSLQLNATNLGDVHYDDLLHPGHVVPGSGRTVLLSANFSL